MKRAREVLALLRAGAIDGLSIGFRTVKGRIDPKTRVRRLDAIDLWEISIVTFPLLAGARVRAVKGLQFSYRRTTPVDANGSPAQKLSHARASAEAEWKRLIGESPTQPTQRVRSVSHG